VIDRPAFVAAPTGPRRENATLSTPAGTIYYALDGTDRLPENAGIAQPASTMNVALPRKRPSRRRVRLIAGIRPLTGRAFYAALM
jgi:hypothetical protein